MTTPQLHKIDPTLKTLATPIEALTPSPRNYRHGDVEAIAASLDRFGQVKPIVVQKSTGIIVAGNHTYKAAQLLGWTRIAAALIDIDDDDADAYLVADNRLSDIATNDDVALAAILSSLSDAGKLAGTGYTPDDVDDLLHTLAQLPAVEPGDFTGDHSPNRSQYDPANTDGDGDRTAGAGPMPHREVVLVLTTDQAEQFGKDIKRLSTVYETTGIAATVLAVCSAAVKRADAQPA